jgi:hypothetical protein
MDLGNDDNLFKFLSEENLEEIEGLESYDDVHEFLAEKGIDISREEFYDCYNQIKEQTNEIEQEISKPKNSKFIRRALAASLAAMSFIPGMSNQLSAVSKEPAAPVKTNEEKDEAKPENSVLKFVKQNKGGLGLFGTVAGTMVGAVVSWIVRGRVGGKNGSESTQTVSRNQQPNYLAEAIKNNGLFRSIVSLHGTSAADGVMNPDDGLGKDICELTNELYDFTIYISHAAGVSLRVYPSADKFEKPQAIDAVKQLVDALVNNLNGVKIIESGDAAVPTASTGTTGGAKVDSATTRAFRWRPGSEASKMDDEVFSGRFRNCATTFLTAIDVAEKGFNANEGDHGKVAETFFKAVKTFLNASRSFVPAVRTRVMVGDIVGDFAID